MHVCHDRHRCTCRQPSAVLHAATAARGAWRAVAAAAGKHVAATEWWWLDWRTWAVCCAPVWRLAAAATAANSTMGPATDVVAAANAALGPSHICVLAARPCHRSNGMLHCRRWTLGSARERAPSPLQATTKEWQQQADANPSPLWFSALKAGQLLFFSGPDPRSSDSHPSASLLGSDCVPELLEPAEAGFKGEAYGSKHNRQRCGRTELSRCLSRCQHVR